MDGEVTPAIGPTVQWWWHGSSAISPAARMRSAPSTVDAQPSNRQAPTSAPRRGPLASAHPIGGPAGSSGGSATIGRASCTGRGEISGGAVLLKKKKGETRHG